VNVLGINAFHSEASAALVVDGQLVAAAEEERFTRIKHDTSFPLTAITYCLEEGNLRLSDLDYIALSRNPRANLRRKATFAIASRAGRKMAVTRAAGTARAMRVRTTLCERLGVPEKSLRAQTRFVEHHLAHLASAFFVSPFDQAAVFSVDGFGDTASTMWGVGQGPRMRVMGEIGFPHSLGIFYTAVTQYLGFHRYGDEFKVMGLASYGEPTYLDEMRKVVSSDGLRFKLDLDYFRHHREGSSMTWSGGAPEIDPVWGEGMVKGLGPARVDQAEPLEARHHDIAASMQRRLEEVELGMLRRLHEMTGQDALCLAGGVALNCVVNGKIFTDTPFRSLYVQPAAHDGGTSVGAAYHVHNQVLGRPRDFVMQHAYFGPSFGAARGRRALEQAGVAYDELDDHALIERVAADLADGKIVGWYQGRMEFGPRALGNRSILADPRRAEMKDVLNARVKHREAFRPFAPSILEEATATFFEQDHPSPFMLQSYRVRDKMVGQIPAPTHVDGTGRLQTVRRDQNPRYYDLIAAFGARTGVPVLLNTSFNDNEPICCTPEEATDTFSRTRMDVLVVGNLYAQKPQDH